MLLQAPAAATTPAEKHLRHEIDRAVSRASVDNEYARHLLADPTMALEDYVYPPQLLLALRSIDASDLVDFARQALALFWNIETVVRLSKSNPRPLTAMGRLPQATAAAH